MNEEQPKTPMLIAMAGLPGTGKSSIASRLAAELPGIVLDKDQIRPMIFLPCEIKYSKMQDDFCVSILYRIAEYRLANNLNRFVILDGRTYSKRRDVDSLVVFAARIKSGLKIIECCCPDTIAKQRLQTDIAQGSHSAQNRTAELYDRLKAEAEPINEPKLVIDTEIKSLEECVKLSMNYIFI